MAGPTRFGTMTLEGYSYSVSGRVRVSLKDIEHVIRVGVGHSVKECREAVRPGGFIFGWQNRLKLERAESIDFLVSVPQADTVVKILEEERSLGDAEVYLWSHWYNLKNKLVKQTYSINREIAPAPPSFIRDPETFRINLKDGGHTIRDNLQETEQEVAMLGEKAVRSVQYTDSLGFVTTCFIVWDFNGHGGVQISSRR